VILSLVGFLGSTPRTRSLVTMSAADFFENTALKAVVGASEDRKKFGNKVLRSYIGKNMACVPINKKSKEIEGLPTIESLTSLRGRLPFGGAITMTDVGVSLITPPGVTKLIVEEAYSLGVRSFFLQPGTYDATTDVFLTGLKDANVVKGCVLVELGFDDH
jgi:uncharacterized protein